MKWVDAGMNGLMHECVDALMNECFNECMEFMKWMNDMHEWMYDMYEWMNRWMHETKRHNSEMNELNELSFNDFFITNSNIYFSDIVFLVFSTFPKPISRIFKWLRNLVKFLSLNFDIDSIIVNINNLTDFSTFFELMLSTQNDEFTSWFK